MSDELPDKVEALVVDDSQTILATAKKMLESEFTVLTAKDGQEAWDIINDNDQIKIVFTDMQMPEMNGMQLLVKIRESDDERIAKLPVIMITGQTDTPAGKRAVFDIGATDFIGKPFDAMDLLSRARSNTMPQRRSSDQSRSQDDDVMLTPSAFVSIGERVMVKAQCTDEEFTIVNVEIDNIGVIKSQLEAKTVRQIIVSIIRRLCGVMRDGDIATRIGENKFTILLYTNEINALPAVERICTHMSKLVFELKGQTLKAELAYGYASLNSINKKQKFTDLCVNADTALTVAKTIKLGHRIYSYSDTNEQPTKVVQNDADDLLPAMINVLDGEYHLVKTDDAVRLKQHMEKYLDYLAKKRR